MYICSIGRIDRIDTMYRIERIDNVHRTDRIDKIDIVLMHNRQDRHDG